MALDTPEHLAATRMFIDQRPENIVLSRVTQVLDGQGGWTKSSPTTLPPQTMRKVATARLADLTARTTEDGATVVPTAYLIAMPDADIQRYDIFELDGVMHEVLYIGRLPEWRIQAEVVERRG